MAMTVCLEWAGSARPSGSSSRWTSTASAASSDSVAECWTPARSSCSAAGSASYRLRARPRGRLAGRRRARTAVDRARLVARVRRGRLIAALGRLRRVALRAGGRACWANCSMVASASTADFSDSGGSFGASSPRAWRALVMKPVTAVIEPASPSCWYDATSRDTPLRACAEKSSRVALIVPTSPPDSASGAGLRTAGSSRARDRAGRGSRRRPRHWWRRSRCCASSRTRCRRASPAERRRQNRCHLRAGPARRYWPRAGCAGRDDDG